ncbi:MAG: hypothetical protein V3575_06355 [Candidatus Absconditabacteria bacterium]
MIHKLKKYGYYVVLLAFVSLLVLGFIKRQQLVDFARNNILGQLDNNSSQTPHSIDSFSTELMKSLDSGKSPNNRKEVIYKFCDSVLNKVKTASGEEINLGGGIMGDQGMKHYQPKKSLFLYNLCSIASTDFQGTFHDDIIKVAAATKQPSGSCDPQSGMNSCDFSEFLPSLFNGIMNDYSNIKLMSLFGNSDEDIHTSIENFSDTYFGKGICGDNIYLNPQTIEESKYSFCSHPKTYKLLFEYIKSVQILKNTTFIDYNKIINQDNNYFNLALVDSSPQLALKNWDLFKDILFNELVFYNLFIVFYGNQINYNTALSPFQVTSDITSVIDESNAEYTLLLKEISLSQQAIFQLDRLMANTYTSFPMHIGLMAYYEDVLNFRYEFAKIYTPVHQLYYKLQNVQDLRR